MLLPMSYRLAETVLVALSLITAAMTPFSAVAHPATFTVAGANPTVPYPNSSGAMISDANAAPPCHSARLTYKDAKAASTAAENEKALELFQAAVEQFELCRSSDTPGSTSALNDEALELDSAEMAGGYFIETGDQRATSLYISAYGLLSDLCFRKSLPDEVKRTLWIYVKVFRTFAPRIGLGPMATIPCQSINMPAPTPTPSP
jgi:hypothetical protein